MIRPNEKFDLINHDHRAFHRKSSVNVKKLLQLKFSQFSLNEKVSIQTKGCEMVLFGFIVSFFVKPSSLDDIKGKINITLHYLLPLKRHKKK